MCHIASLVATGISIVSVFINGLEVSWYQWPSLFFYPNGWDEICSRTNLRRSYMTSHRHNISLRQPKTHNAHNAHNARMFVLDERESSHSFAYFAHDISWREEGRTCTVLTIVVLNITVKFLCFCVAFTVTKVRYYGVIKAVQRNSSLL